MNINYETGNVIKNATAEGTIGEFAFPATLPTEEWGGGEVRSYQNYVRPVANLFENDRENNALIKDIFKGIGSANKNGVIYGCEVVRNQTNNYYEVQRGAFIYDNEIYYIYPTCNALAKQIESEYQLAGFGDLRLTITYDEKSNTYSYASSIPVSNSSTGTADNAVSLVSVLLTGLGLPSQPENIISHIILPIFSTSTLNTSTIYFDGTEIKADKNTPAEDSIIFATLDSTTGDPDNRSKTYTTINGAKIGSGSINNGSIMNHKVTIGSTDVELGASVANFAGVDTINEIKIEVDGGIGISHTPAGSSAAAYSITADSNYALKNACTKEVLTDSSSFDSQGGKLPTASAVSSFVAAQINTQARDGQIVFNDGIVTNGNSDFNSNINMASGAKLVIYNASNASKISDTLSSSASIYTKGGIEVEKDIYSNGNIVGLNSGTYSLRKIKENITPFKKSAVKLINDVKIVNYNYIADADKNHKVGFIADDTDELLSTKNHNIMDQSNCIGILLKAVQELSAEIKKIKEEINGLKSNVGEEQNTDI